MIRSPEHTSGPAADYSQAFTDAEWQAYDAGWHAAQGLMRQRLVRVAERLAQLEPCMSGEAKDASDEIRTMIMLVIAR